LAVSKKGEIMTQKIELLDSSVFKERFDKADLLLSFAHRFLTNKKNVSIFLNISIQTVNNHIANGRFEEGVHYNIEDNSIVFIPQAILDFKLNPPKKANKKPSYQPSDEALRFIS